MSPLQYRIEQFGFAYLLTAALWVRGARILLGVRVDD